MKEASNQPSLRERLKAKKEASSALLNTTLPVSGETVSYPGFISHEKVMAASKIAGKNRQKVGMIVVAQVCRFGEDRLTVDEIGSLLCNRDTVHLINLVLGDDDDESDAEDAPGN